MFKGNKDLESKLFHLQELLKNFTSGESNPSKGNLVALFEVFRAVKRVIHSLKGSHFSDDLQAQNELSKSQKAYYAEVKSLVQQIEVKNEELMRFSMKRFCHLSRN